MVHKTFTDSIGSSACGCGNQASHIRNIVLPVEKTNHLGVHKTFSDSIAPSACVCVPHASHGRNTVPPVDKTNMHVYVAIKPLTIGLLCYL